jgi:ABC-type sulfate/molybdate transport systems ATPase subunit
MSLEIRQLVKRFDQQSTPVLDHIDVTIPTGSLTCLLGASGVGKSTLLQIIAGLLPADEGTVALASRPLDALPPYWRPVTLLMQQPQLFAHLDVRDNVAFGLRVRGVERRRRRRRADELLDLVGIAHLRARPVTHLSGGEQQRVALARALAIEPEILLADEPFASVDASVRRDLQQLLKQVHAELGTTMLMVTHDVAEAFAVADHWVVLESGRVVVSGTPMAVFNRPPTPAIARMFDGTHPRVPYPQPTVGASADIDECTPPMVAQR